MEQPRKHKVSYSGVKLIDRQWTRINTETSECLAECLVESGINGVYDLTQIFRTPRSNYFKLSAFVRKASGSIEDKFVYTDVYASMITKTDAIYLVQKCYPTCPDRLLEDMFEIEIDEG